MSKSQISTALFATFLGVLAIAPKAVADEYNKKTIVTITEPVEVPGGVTLQPGRYVFKLADSQNDRHIVMIQSERENHTFATVFAVNNFRLVPKGKVRFTFWETPSGQPKAIRAWFYPGDNYGQEFLYKHERATQIASTQTTHEEVPTEPAVEQPAPAPQDSTVIAQNTPPPTPEPAPAPVKAAPAAPVPAPEPPAPPASALVAENTTPATLPQTASNMPLLALAGFVSIGIALVLGIFVRRMG